MTNMLKLRNNSLQTAVRRPLVLGQFVFVQSWFVGFFYLDDS